MPKSLFSLISSAALALALVSQAGATTVTIGGTAVAGEGLETSVVGATTTTFDGLTTLPLGYNAIGTTPVNPLVIGSTSSTYKAPTGDTSTYLTTGTGLIFNLPAAGVTYFGFYWGSLDSYNDFTITDSQNHTYNMTGAQLASSFGLNADGNSSYFVNFFADAGTTFKAAGFSSSVNSFEFDNVATATPEPGTVAMLSGGLLILAGAMRRRKAA